MKKVINYLQANKVIEKKSDIMNRAYDIMNNDNIGEGYKDELSYLYDKFYNDKEEDQIEKANILLAIEHTINYINAL